MVQGDVLRYGGNALAGDFGRSGAGLALTLPPLLFIDVHPVVGAVLGAMALLFAVFLVRTIERRATAVRRPSATLRISAASEIQMVCSQPLQKT